MEPNNQYEHALRRSWLSGISFSMCVHTFFPFAHHPRQFAPILSVCESLAEISFHWPLCASLVLASAASGEMMKHNEVESGLEWCVSIHSIGNG